MDAPDILAIYRELDSIKTVVNGHSNHLGTLDDKVDFLKDIVLANLGMTVAVVGLTVIVAITLWLR